MEAKIIRRALVILGIIVFVIVASVACNAIARSETNPEITNPDDVFMTFGNVEITNDMLYERMKVDDGLTQLINHIDQTLLAEYMEAVSEDEIEAEILAQTYGTTDAEEIDLLSDFEKAEMEQDFRDGLIVSGFNPDDEDNVETFIRMVLAQEGYTKEQYRTTDDESNFYITMGDLEQFYNDYEQGTLIAIPLRFFNADERDSVFNHFNIVRNFEGGFGRYIGDENMEELEEDDFTEDNTETLDDDQVRVIFIEIYNYLNQHREAIDSNASIEDLIAWDHDYFRFNQGELQALATERQDEDFTPYTDLSTYLFEDLKDAEQPYSLHPTTIRGERYYFYALEYEDVEAFEDLSLQEDIFPLRDRYIDTLVGDDQIDQALFDLHRESDLKIYDSLLARAYQMRTGYDGYVEGERKSDVIATFGDHSLSVDDYFEAMAENVGAATALNIAQTKYMFQSDYFEDLYGSRRSVWNNNSEMMKMHRDHVREEKSIFSSGAYAQFGLNPEAISWTEYLHMFGAGHNIRQYYRQMQGYQPMAMYSFSQRDHFAGEEALLERMVEHILRYDMIYDQSDYDLIHELVTEQYENYFNLSVEELLLFMDDDFDFTPDNYEEMLEHLEAPERDQLESLHEALFDTIQTMIDEEEMSLEDIIAEYKTALRGEDEDDEDYSVWARFKNAGWRLERNDLGTLNFRNTRNEPEAFVENLQALYQMMLDDDDLETLESYVITHGGVHFKLVERGEDFDRPSARDDDNDSNIPSIDQLQRYTRMLVSRFQNKPAGIVFEEDVEAALEMFYQPALNRIISDYHFDILMIDYLNEQNYSFTHDDAYHKNRLEALYDVYHRILFPHKYE